MTNIRFDTFCNITQEPQDLDLQRWCLVFRFSVKSNKILLHYFMSKQVSVHRGLLLDQLEIANTYIILDGFECDTRIYRRSHENTARVEDECGIFMASAVYSRITRKKSHPILLLLYYTKVFCLKM